MSKLFKVACNPEPGIKGAGFEYGESMNRADAVDLWSAGVAQFRAHGFRVRKMTMYGTLRRAEIVNPYSGKVEAITAVVPA
jgi:hypothetical protein